MTQPTRRRPGELRADILRAAGALFRERGFDGTSMRDIATEAATTQAMLYRHFPGKVAVFDAAVAAPFREFLTEFLADWKTHSVPDLPNRELFARFNARLYDLAVQHRKTVLAVLAAQAFSGDAVGDLADLVATGIPEVVEHLKSEQAARGWEGIDMDVAARSAIAMTLGTALMSEWLYGSELARIGRDRILSELTEFQLTGTAARDRRPDGSAWSDSNT